MFKGYCFNEDGTYTSPVEIDSPKQAVDYCVGLMEIAYEVRVIDEDDYIVVQAKQGKLIFPDVCNESNKCIWI